jgi:hypothetical protein
LLLANHRSLAEAPPDRADEQVAIERVRNALDFHHWGLGPRPGSPLDEVGPPDPLTLLASPEGDRLSTEIWAELALRVLASTGPSPRGTSRETRAALWFTHDLKELAAARRRCNRLDPARRIVDRLSALAELLVKRNPDDASAYLVLADAYEQQSKNAWRPTPDRTAIERNLWQSIAMNRRALELAPHEEVARHELQRRERKLDDLLHPH